MKKVFGWRTIVSLVLGIIWMGIIFDNTTAIIVSAAVVLLAIVFLVPLFIFNSSSLTIFSLNPLKLSRKINYTDIDHVTIHAGDYHCKLTIHTKDASAATTNSFLRYYDMEDLYKQIRNLNVPVTSTGVRAISWPS